MLILPQRDSFCQAKSLAIAGTLASFSSSVFFKCCGSSCRCFFVISLGLLMHTTDVRALCLKSTFLLMANRWCLGVKENYSLALTCSVTRRLSSHWMKRAFHLAYYGRVPQATLGFQNTKMTMPKTWNQKEQRMVSKSKETVKMKWETNA